MTSVRSPVLVVGVLAILVGFFLGGAVSQTRAVDDPTFSDDPPNAALSPKLTMVTGQLKGSPDTEALYVLRQSDQKLAIYVISGQVLELRHMRSLSPDFDVGEAFSKGGSQSPTPEEMRGFRKK